MNLLEDTLNYFGLQFKPKEKKKNLSGSLSTGIEDDGSSTVVSTNSFSSSFGTYLDVDGQVKNELEAIRKYREISLFAEVDCALQDIVNEAIPQEPETKMVHLNLDKLEGISNGTKDKLLTEFDEILRLYNYDERSVEMFKRWYVDGRLAYQIIVDKDKLGEGIQKLVMLDGMNIRKIKDIKTKKSTEGATLVDTIEEYYLYTDTGFGSFKQQNSPQSSQAPTTGLKISKDAVVFVPSGVIDYNTNMTLSHLHKAIRPINQLRMLEDATIVYFIARAPERRIFYVDVGNLPKLKADQYLKDIMNRYRNKMVYDGSTGAVKSDKKYLSMLEDFWMPRRDGNKGTEITSLQGAQNISGYLDNLQWFKEKMYESLDIPKSRLQPTEGFSLGRSQELSRDEVKFQKFVNKLRNKFGQVLLDALSAQLKLKGIVNTEEWNDIKPFIRLDFQKDNYFAELKNQELITSRLQVLQQADLYVGKYFSRDYIMREILALDDDDLRDMERQIAKEASNNLAQPEWKRQGEFQQDQQMDMMKQQLEMQPPMPEQGEQGQEDNVQSQNKGQSVSFGTSKQDQQPSKEPEYDVKNYKQNQKK